MKENNMANAVEEHNSPLDVLFLTEVAKGDAVIFNSQCTYAI